MLINFPAGMIMAFYANGHLPSKIAFIILRDRSGIVQCVVNTKDIDIKEQTSARKI